MLSTPQHIVNCLSGQSVFENHYDMSDAKVSEHSFSLTLTDAAGNRFVLTLMPISLPPTVIEKL